jgi:hypothetical protein
MPKITLCRFGSEGQLESFEADTNATEFIAISHGWVPADWTDIPGIQNQVIISQHKAEFLKTKLLKLVGQLPLWMDVLCVDQRSKAARIAVVQSIPDIYRYVFNRLLSGEWCGDYLHHPNPDSCWACLVSVGRDFCDVPNTIP